MSTGTNEPLGLIDVLEIEYQARRARAEATGEIAAALKSQCAKFVALFRLARNGQPKSGHPQNGAFA